MREKQQATTEHDVADGASQPAEPVEDHEPNGYEQLQANLKWCSRRWAKRKSIRSARVIDVLRLIVEIGTLGAVVAAGVFAYRSWIAVKASNEINERSYVAAQRAYVTVTGLDIQPVDPDPTWARELLPFWRVVPIIVNTGNTPTKNMWWAALMKDMCGKSIWWLPDHRDIPCDGAPHIMTFKDLQSATRNRLVLGPRQEARPIGLGSDALTTQDRLGIIQGRQRYFIHGTVVYEDFVSPVIHITRYCFSLWHNGAVLGPNGISFSFCGGETNCSDDECSDYEQLKTLGTKAP